MEDPFAGVIKSCEIRAADEEELCSCPFSREFDNSPQSSGSPSSSPVQSEPTGIIMLSLPDSDSIDQSSPHKNEELQTPSKQLHSQTCFSGSGDQRPSTSRPVDLPAADYGDSTEAQVMVNLGKQNDNLDEALKKRIRVCEKDLWVRSSIPQIGKKKPIVVDVDNKIKYSECEVVEDNGISRNVGFAVKECGERGVIVHEDGTNGVDGSVRRRRKLPLWMSGEEAVKKLQFTDMIEAAMVVIGETNNGESKNDADFLETAKRRGVCFPRPRWWPLDQL